MPESKKRSKGIKVFLDSSVIIAAILSFSGGSFRLIRESLFREYTLLISDYVLEECLRILKLKFPEKTFIFPMMLDSFRLKIVKDPSPKEVEPLLETVGFEDAPILAAAIKYKVDYLVTLDRKHLLNQRVLELAKSKRISVLTPGEFLQVVKNR